MQSVTVKDAIVNPHITMDRYKDPLKKQDPSYHELRKRNTKAQDMFMKASKTDQARVLIKVDANEYGHRNPGLYCQTFYPRK